MPRLALDMLLACGLFFVISYLLGGLFFDEGFGTAALTDRAFGTVIFAMVYGAIRVGMLVFSGRD